MANRNCDHCKGTGTIMIKGEPLPCDCAVDLDYNGYEEVESEELLS